MPIQHLTRLCDIVFAVSMTILSIAFNPLPEASDSTQSVTEMLWSQLPDLSIYVITFVTLALSWYTHVEQFQHYQKTDGIHIFLRLSSLQFVVILAYASELSTVYEEEFAVQVLYRLVGSNRNWYFLLSRVDLWHLQSPINRD